MAIYRAEEFEHYKLKFKNKYGQDGSDLPFCINLDMYLLGHHIRTVTLDKLTFAVHGCAGTKETLQKNIAQAINKDKEISFNLLLGDNIYRHKINPYHGIRDDSHLVIANTIKEYYTDIYGNLLSFCILGNHDYNYWGWGKGEKGPQVAIRQVEASYIPERKKSYGGWQMPYRYYVLYSKIFNTVFFMLDSDTFLWDEKQFTWFFAAYKLFHTSKYKILCQHHPLQTFGKRVDEDNVKMYLEKLASIKPVVDFNERQSLGNQINSLFDKYGIKFDLAFCAHDHFLEVRKLANGTIQCISGSAGAVQSKAKDNAPSKKAEDYLDKLGKGKLEKENQALLNKNGYVKVSINKNTPPIILFQEAPSNHILLTSRGSDILTIK